MTKTEKEIWEFLHAHLASIFAKDWKTYSATTDKQLSLYEHFVTPHRQDGLEFHKFMIEHSWATGNDAEGKAKAHRFDLLEPRLQVFGNPAHTAIACYSLMLSVVTETGIVHRTHNESRVLIKEQHSWRVVHVHKSPGA